MANVKCLLITTFLLFIAACGQPGFDEHMAKAKLLTEKSEYSSATLELKSALQIKPEDPVARYLLGALYLKQLLVKPATKELRKSLEAGYQDSAILLAKAMAKQGLYKELLKKLKRKIAIKHRDEWRLIKVEALIAMNKLDDAIKVKEQLSISDPHGINSNLANAYIAIVQQNQDEGMSWIDKALAIDPTNAQALETKAQLLLASKDYQNALEIYKKLAAKTPNWISYQFMVIETSFAMQDLETARATTLKLEQRGVRHIRHIFNQAQLALYDKNYTLARDLSASILGKVDHPGARLVNGIASYYTENWEAARQNLAHVVPVLPDGHIARQLLADVQFKLGKTSLSAETLKQQGELSSSHVPLMLAISSRLRQEGEIQEGEALLQQAKDLAKVDKTHQLQLGMAELMKGDLDSGISFIEKSISENETNSKDAEAFLFWVYLKSDRLQDALILVQKMQQSRPDKAIGYNLEALLKAKSKQYGSAKNLLAKATSIEPENTLSLMLMGNLSLVDKDTDKARALYERVLSLRPTHIGASQILTVLDMKKGDPQAAINRLKKIVDSGKAPLPTKYILAKVYAHSQQYGSATMVLSGMPEQEKEGVRWLSLAAEVAARDGDIGRAEQLYRNLHIADPEQPLPLYRLAQIMEKQGKLENFLHLLKQNEEKGNSYRLPVKLLEISVNTKLGHFVKANKLVKSIPNKYSQEIQVRELKANLALAEQNYPEAERLYTEMYQQQPSRVRLLGLAKAQFKGGRVQQSIDTLAQWLVQHPDDLLVRQTLANSMLTGGQNKQAELEYKILLEKAPKNVAVLNNYAWLQHLAGNPEAGLDIIKKAYVIEPDNPGVLDTYGVLLMDLDKSKESIAFLENAADLSSNPSIQLHLAQALFSGNDYAKAKRMLTRILAKEVDFPERDEAEQLKAFIAELDSL